jgi:hypothetical protein
VKRFKRETALAGIIIICLLFFSCINERQKSVDYKIEDGFDALSSAEEGEIKTIHVFVALCDNKYQGITPVSASLGNGQNHNSNLYWGALYGVRSFFKRSDEWKLFATRKASGIILERLVFKHAAQNFYLIADAYDGRYIKECTLDFLNSSSGNQKDTLSLGGRALGTGGSASLLAYVGHDGLMDFQLSETFVNTDDVKRDVIILACYSKRYFSPHLEKANVNPLLWTTHLMAPEAYTLHDAITGYIDGEGNDEVRERGAAAYAKYQKCSLNAAKGLLVTGW